MRKIAIIGAGISGLTLANKLNKDFDVVVYEKSRGMGGRIATRRADEFQFDHGAQFFTAKTKTFNALVSEMIKEKVVMRWDAKFKEFVGDKAVRSVLWDDSHPHFVGVPSMNAVAKYLARGLNVILETKVIKAEKTRSKWTLFDENSNRLGEYDIILFAIPSNQASEVIPSTFKYYDNLKAIKMKGCYSLMLASKNKINFDFDAAYIKESIISWVSVNSSKPMRGHESTVVVTSTNDWADQNIETELNLVTLQLCNELERIIGCDISAFQHKNIHKWRYANIDKQKDETVFYDQENKIGACGDWCIQGRVESAFLSATQILEAILDEVLIREN
jgi:renalase